jgi:hypothetical protein
VRTVSVRNASSVGIIPQDDARPCVTRFDADAPAERRELIADAVRAHRERESHFCTVEADPEFADEMGVPWVQFGDGLVNLDCTDEELDRLTDLLSARGGMSVTERASPEDADGTNVRIEVHGDAERVAGLVEDCFREVYALPEDVRVWAVAV